MILTVNFITENFRVLESNPRRAMIFNMQTIYKYVYILSCLIFYNFIVADHMLDKRRLNRSSSVNKDSIIFILRN